MDGYFDFNATTPLFPQARDAMMEALNAHWHNPSSLYHEAGETKRRLEECRESIASHLGVAVPERLIFTSGATESNHLVVTHHRQLLGPEQKMLTSTMEHPCLREPARRLFGDHCLEAPVHAEGTVDLDWILHQLETDPTIGFVSIMTANNESGALQPWQEIQEACRSRGIPFHTDAAQWIGKLPSDALAECDWITGSAHKFGGPKGIGFLILPEDFEGPLLGAQTGGPQERKLRAGTENYPAIASMAAALDAAQSALASSSPAGRDQFEATIQEEIPGLKLLGRGADRLWNTSMFVVPEHGNLKWLIHLSHDGFQVSTGSACSAGKGNPSHVMEAMGLSFQDMGRVIRVSGGWQTAKEDWQALADTLVQTWHALQSGDSEDRRKRTISLGDASL